MHNWVRHSALLPAEPHNFRLLNGIPTLTDTLVECRSLLSHHRSSQRTRRIARRHGTLEDRELLHQCLRQQLTKIQQAWTRLIRFVAAETSLIHIGEPVDRHLDSKPPLPPC